MNACAPRNMAALADSSWAKPSTQLRSPGPGRAKSPWAAFASHEALPVLNLVGLHRFRSGVLPSWGPIPKPQKIYKPYQSLRLEWLLGF